MGESIDVDQAKSRFDRLVARAEAGEEITLTRHGRPVARLASPPRPTQARVPGAWRGRVAMHDELDAFTADDDAHWYGARES